MGIKFTNVNDLAGNIASGFPEFQKARVKAHQRKTKSGKISQVREYTDSRQKKEQDRKKNENLLKKLIKKEKDGNYYINKRGNIEHAYYKDSEVKKRIENLTDSRQKKEQESKNVYKVGDNVSFKTSSGMKKGKVVAVKPEKDGSSKLKIETHDTGAGYEIWSDESRLKKDNPKEEKKEIKEKTKTDIKKEKQDSFQFIDFDEYLWRSYSGAEPFENGEEPIYVEGENEKLEYYFIGDGNGLFASLKFHDDDDMDIKYFTYEPPEWVKKDKKNTTKFLKMMMESIKVISPPALEKLGWEKQDY